jgi:hypothetical protein
LPLELRCPINLSAMIYVELVWDEKKRKSKMVKQKTGLAKLRAWAREARLAGVRRVGLRKRTRQRQSANEIPIGPRGARSRQLPKGRVGLPSLVLPTRMNSTYSSSWLLLSVDGEKKRLVALSLSRRRKMVAWSEQRNWGLLWRCCSRVLLTQLAAACVRFCFTVSRSCRSR